MEELKDIDISKLPSPCYVVDERLLKKNLDVLDYVQVMEDRS